MKAKAWKMIPFSTSSEPVFNTLTWFYAINWARIRYNSWINAYLELPCADIFAIKFWWKFILSEDWQRISSRIRAVGLCAHITSHSHIELMVFACVIRTHCVWRPGLLFHRYSVDSVVAAFVFFKNHKRIDIRYSKTDTTTH